MQRVVRSIIPPAGGLRDRVALFTGREYAKGIAEKKKRILMFFRPPGRYLQVSIFTPYMLFQAEPRPVVRSYVVLCICC